MFDFIDFNLANFTAFLLASLLISLVPGPDVAFIVSRSIVGGRKVGIATAFGMQLGILFHILLAAFGLSAILMTSALAFQIVKYIGAAYLVYLGIQTIRDKSGIKIQSGLKNEGVRKAFWQGAITDVFNPKVALFFLTFLPQFIHPSQGSTFWQFIILGIIFGLIGLVIDISYSIIASWFRNALTRNSNMMQWQKRISGVTLLGLGAWLALEEKS